MTPRQTLIQDLHSSNGCVFSPCRRYRYALLRQWESTSLWPCSRFDQYVQVIGLNPSTADETKNDPTIRRCIGFARSWGFGALVMTNLFAWRDTKPANMKKAAEPVGAENDQWLERIASSAGLILAAWGAHGSHLGRADVVRKSLERSGRRVHYLRLNDDGSPGHPLYIPAETKPVAFEPISDLAITISDVPDPDLNRALRVIERES